MPIRHGSMRCVAACLMMAALAAAHAAGTSGDGWSTAWMAAMLPSPVPANMALGRPRMVAPVLHGQTLRQRVVIEAGGQRLRIRLSNRYGHTPLRIDAVTVGVLAAEAAAPARLQRLGFDGRRKVVVPAGATRHSDALALPLRAGQTLVVSLHVVDGGLPATWHLDALRDNAISPPGDFSSVSAMPVATTTGAVLWLSAVQVQGDAVTPALVALGDSITNGFRSSRNLPRSYPQQLATRLRQLRPACPMAVLDAGIDGNEISGRDGGYGPGDSMLQRFGRDVLDQPGARYVLLLGGINDIGETTMVRRAQGKTLDGAMVASNVIATQQQLIGRAHAAGLHIMGATLPPFEGAWNAYSPAGERARQEVNNWIRHQAHFDGIVDFDAALRDPHHPTRLQADLDSGDHIHPNDHGYAAMAAAVIPALPSCPH